MANNKKNNSRNLLNNNIYAFADFSQGLYLLDTPRGISEQLNSLAIVDGRNIWAEHGALVPQYGYLKLASLPTGEVISTYTKASASNDGFFIITRQGNVYYYSISQGLKEYKTTLEAHNEEPIIARRDNDIVITMNRATRLFGSYYSESTPIVITSNASVMNFGTYWQFEVPAIDAKYYWTGKSICIGTQNVPVTISAIATKEEQNTIVLTTSTDNSITISSTENISEKCSIDISDKLVYKKEDSTSSQPPITIEPILMEVSQNRLFIVSINGTIYYSAIGIIDDFDETNGAGFFGGFYNDTSNILSIEDFLTGTLIVRKNGLYYLKIGQEVSIEKISQAQQEYASDHVIIGEKVYAYDKNSGALVLAVAQNVFGALTAGKTLVASEFLSYAATDLRSTKRFLTYNFENELFCIYYGENLNKGILYTKSQSLFPREVDVRIKGFLGINQTVLAVTQDGQILQTFRKNTIIPTLSSVVTFEAIGLRDNRMIQSCILEVTELAGLPFKVTTTNTSTSIQSITPSRYISSSSEELLPFIYSDDIVVENSYELTSRWVEQTSNMTRVYAPMSGRNGISITLEFEAGKQFCLSLLRLSDFCQGVT